MSHNIEYVIIIIQVYFTSEVAVVEVSVENTWQQMIQNNPMKFPFQALWMDGIIKSGFGKEIQLLDGAKSCRLKTTTRPLIYINLLHC